MGCIVVFGVVRHEKNCFLLAQKVNPKKAKLNTKVMFDLHHNNLFIICVFISPSFPWNYLHDFSGGRSSDRHKIFQT